MHFQSLKILLMIFVALHSYNLTCQEQVQLSGPQILKNSAYVVGGAGLLYASLKSGRFTTLVLKGTIWTTYISSEAFGSNSSAGLVFAMGSLTIGGMLALFSGSTAVLSSIGGGTCLYKGYKGFKPYVQAKINQHKH
jgi:hypothetical protein